MSMELCENGHDLIVFEAVDYYTRRPQKCPICKIIKEKDNLIDDLKSEISDLKEEK